jgi:hypothetical protein
MTILPLPRQTPVDDQALAAFPRVRSSVAFGRRPYYRVHCSRRAGIRNPTRFRPLGNRAGIASYTR